MYEIGSKLLHEIGWRGTQRDTYKFINKLKDKVIDDNITFSSKFDLEVQNDFERLPIIYWLLEMMNQKDFVIGSYERI